MSYNSFLYSSLVKVFRLANSFDLKRDVNQLMCRSADSIFKSEFGILLFVS